MIEANSVCGEEESIKASKHHPSGFGNLWMLLRPEVTDEWIMSHSSKFMTDLAKQVSETQRTEADFGYD